jgi:trans-aconitate 2-methyltransferase
VSWNPALYDRYKDERSRPFFDLLALVRPRKGMRVVDLGCGTGALTRQMHERLGARETLGIDSSPEMLARAAAEATHGLRFEQGDLATFDGKGGWDVVFSNAALHWAPDHPSLLARLAGALAPRGQLAVQVPASFHQPSHLVAQEVAAEEPFRSALSGHAHPVNILTPEGYARVLDRLGFREQRARLEVYVHHLASREDVVTWFEGTLLTDYEKRLSKEMFARFVARYHEVLMTRLPDEKPFFFPMERILFWGEL